MDRSTKSKPINLLWVFYTLSVPAGPSNINKNHSNVLLQKELISNEKEGMV